MRVLPILVVAAGLAGCVSKSKHNATLAELAKCREENTACGKDRDAARARVTVLEKDLGTAIADLGTEHDKRQTAEKQLAELEANLNATRAEIEQLRKARAEAEKRLQAFKDLTAKFKKMIDSGKVQVTFRRGQMILQLPAGILFASGKAELSREGQAAIADVAKILKEFPDRRWAVGGHTDNLPLPKGSKYKDNWDLSSARALTVTKKLIFEGVPGTALSATGFGEFDPVNTNASEEERQANRRIEIILVPNIEELPTMEEPESP
jgi:chemotaxis protein MotB